MTQQLVANDNASAFVVHDRPPNVLLPRSFRDLGPQNHSGYTSIIVNDTLTVKSLRQKKSDSGAGGGS